ncbi:hypothetical protein GCM10023116_22430 [Kistimonas scapharcae]|uniref:Uncharacterized protein n=1 Tax=Kistimonas scapharcae TaxID=1036133 RepID=A0ABP8V3U3_9GAMM
MEIQKQQQKQYLINHIKSESKITGHLGYVKREDIINGMIVEPDSLVADSILFHRAISSATVSTQVETSDSEQVPPETPETSIATPMVSPYGQDAQPALHPMGSLNPVNHWAQQFVPPPAQTTPRADIHIRATEFFEKLEKLTRILLDPNQFYEHESSWLFMWNLKKDGAPETCHYSSPLVRTFHQILSVMFEQQVYQSINWQSDRAVFFNRLQACLSSSHSLDGHHRQLLGEFIDNAKQTDQVLYDLAVQLGNNTFIGEHHDRLCGLLIEKSNRTPGRHCSDTSPYFLIKMANTLTYVLTTDLSKGLTTEHVFNIVMKLGHPRRLADATTLAVTLPVERKRKVTGLKALVEMSVVTYKTPNELDSTIKVIRHQVNSNERIVLATHNNAEPNSTTKSSLSFSINVFRKKSKTICNASFFR